MSRGLLRGRHSRNSLFNYEFHEWREWGRDFGSVVARGADPGAVRLFDPPGSPRRATAGITSPFVSIRVHLRLKMADFPEKAGFQAGNREFESKIGRKTPNMRGVGEIGG